MSACAECDPRVVRGRPGTSAKNKQARGNHGTYAQADHVSRGEGARVDLCALWYLTTLFHASSTLLHRTTTSACSTSRTVPDREFLPRAAGAQRGAFPEARTAPSSDPPPFVRPRQGPPTTIQSPLRTVRPRCESGPETCSYTHRLFSFLSRAPGSGPVARASKQLEKGAAADADALTQTSSSWLPVRPAPLATPAPRPALTVCGGAASASQQAASGWDMKRYYRNKDASVAAMALKLLSRQHRQASCMAAAAAHHAPAGLTDRSTSCWPRCLRALTALPRPVAPLVPFTAVS